MADFVLGLADTLPYKDDKRYMITMDDYFNLNKAMFGLRTRKIGAFGRVFYSGAALNGRDF